MGLYLRIFIRRLDSYERTIDFINFSDDYNAVVNILLRTAATGYAGWTACFRICGVPATGFG